MTLLTFGALVVWLAVAIFMARGAVAAGVGRHVRRGDPMRLACFVVAVIFISYQVRALLWPEDVASGVALKIASIVAAGYLIALGRAYGRGDFI